jgi:hypothetical protein
MESHRQDLTFKFNKGAELFVGVHSETPSVMAVCVNNPDCSGIIWNLVTFGSVITSFASEPIALAFPRNFHVF